MIDINTTRWIGSVVTIVAWLLWMLGTVNKIEIIDKKKTVTKKIGKKWIEDDVNYEVKRPLDTGAKFMSMAVTTFLMGNWLAILWLKF